MSELQWGERTYVMGIVNVTPDSFSGDGLVQPGRDQAAIVATAVEQARGFVDAGADILDVGAESTRPASVYGEHPQIDAETELRLAIPVVSALAREFAGRALVSIDTTKGIVAQEALAAGARMVNDVWAGRRDGGTVRAAAAAGAYLVLMHSSERAEYPEGLLPQIAAWLAAAVSDAVAAGVPRDRVVVDPGIGFGKTPAQSIEVLHRLAELKAALGGLPMLVGTSRKRFIGEILGGAPPSERVEGTAATVALAIAAGADVVRVHDVQAMMKTVRVADAIVRATIKEVSSEDRISLIGMRFLGRHGVLVEERLEPQPFEVDLVLHADLGVASTSDSLTDTADYARLFERVRQIVEGESFRLIEALAGAIASATLGATDPALVHAVEVRVRKPQAPLPGIFGHVEAALVRRRPDESDAS